MEKDPDSDLLDALRKNKNEAFSELINQHAQRLYQTIFRILRNPIDAEESLQKTFVDVWKGLDSFSGQSKLSTWMFRVATNRALMCLRERNAHEKRKDELLEEPSVNSPQERGLLEREKFLLVHDAINELPDKFRVPLVLRYFNELTDSEGCAILGINHHTFKTRVHRARKMLKRKLYGKKMAVNA